MNIDVKYQESAWLIKYYLDFNTTFFVQSKLGVIRYMTIIKLFMVMVTQLFQNNFGLGLSNNLQLFDKRKSTLGKAKHFKR